MSDFPIIPLNGRVLIEELPFRPSKTIECVSGDRADFTEGIVRALSEHKLGRKFTKKGGWEHSGATFPHDVKVGDRVVLRGKYLDDDLVRVNNVRYRVIDPWELEAIITEAQPDHFRHPVTGDIIPDKHPIHILGE